jgi:hypothetical protein
MWIYFFAYWNTRSSSSLKSSLILKTLHNVSHLKFKNQKIRESSTRQERVHALI